MGLGATVHIRKLSLDILGKSGTVIYIVFVMRQLIYSQEYDLVACR
jgi:hypothetical protein